LDKMNLKNKSLLSFEELLEKIKQDKIHVLVTMGAGNIDLLVEPIEQILKQKN
jgi:UDP-N-acetylmuramate--alanine ligase